MNREFSMEIARITEYAAIASARWWGKGDKIAADGAATEAMRAMFDSVSIAGTVVIGEGEMDEAPMLYIGEKVGKWDEGCLPIFLPSVPTSLSRYLSSIYPSLRSSLKKYFQKKLA